MKLNKLNLTIVLCVVSFLLSSLSFGFAVDQGKKQSAVKPSATTKSVSSKKTVKKTTTKASGKKVTKKTKKPVHVANKPSTKAPGATSTSTKKKKPLPTSTQKPATK